jgi:NTP pyrophosphatase (non-canonical NTP hydrolase)
MTPEEYTKNCLRTEPFQYSFGPVGRITPRIQHAVDGLVTESGELVDALKRHRFYGKELDKVNLVEEAGDLCWYLSVLFDELGVSWEEAWDWNIRKLQKRFPEKFTEEAALNRDLDSEREVLDESKEVLEAKEEASAEPYMVTMASGKKMDLLKILKDNPPFFETQEQIKHVEVAQNYNEYPVNKNGEIVGYMYGRAR